MPQWGRLSLPVHSEVCSRAHCYVEDVAERSEQKLDNEQFCFVEGCQRAGDELAPLPMVRLRSGLTLVYVHGQHKQGQGGVIEARVSWQPLSGRCFALV
jgi:hypothetical protein